MKTRNIPTLLAAIIDAFNRTGFRSHLRIATAVSLVAAGLVSAILTLALSSTASSARPAGPPVIGYDQMQALTTSIDGAQVLRTTRTVTHWFGSTFDPNNGVTYGYNIVGADPNNCSGAECDVTVTADIIPVNVIVVHPEPGVPPRVAWVMTAMVPVCPAGTAVPAVSYVRIAPVEERVLGGARRIMLALGARALRAGVVGA